MNDCPNCTKHGMDILKCENSLCPMKLTVGTKQLQEMYQELECLSDMDCLPGTKCIKGRCIKGKCVELNIDNF